MKLAKAIHFFTSSTNLTLGSNWKPQTDTEITDAKTEISAWEP